MVDREFQKRGRHNDLRVQTFDAYFLATLRGSVMGLLAIFIWRFITAKPSPNRIPGFWSTPKGQSLLSLLGWIVLGIGYIAVFLYMPFRDFLFIMAIGIFLDYIYPGVLERRERRRNLIINS